MQLPNVLFGGGKFMILAAAMMMTFGFISGGAAVGDSPPKLEERLEADMYTDDGKPDEASLRIFDAVVIEPFLRICIGAADIGAHLGYMAGQTFGKTAVKIVGYGVVLLLMSLYLVIDLIRWKHKHGFNS
jgi:hypothetical protein